MTVISNGININVNMKNLHKIKLQIYEDVHQLQHRQPHNILYSKVDRFYRKHDKIPEKYTVMPVRRDMIYKSSLFVCYFTYLNLILLSQCPMPVCPVLFLPYPMYPIICPRKTLLSFCSTFYSILSYPCLVLFMSIN